jgi:hypothetical protein
MHLTLQLKENHQFPLGFQTLVFWNAASHSMAEIGKMSTYTGKSNSQLQQNDLTEHTSGTEMKLKTSEEPLFLTYSRREKKTKQLLHFWQMCVLHVPKNFTEVRANRKAFYRNLLTS